MSAIVEFSSISEAKEALKSNAPVLNDRFIEVESGLNQGDKIVVKGYEFLRNRGKVKIMK